MPVIRSQRNASSLSADRKHQLATELADELASRGGAAGPVIFEIPLDRDRFDVLVVWDEWNGVRSEERTDLILEAYPERRDSIAQALGVTYSEAMDQGLLPYAVISMARRDETDINQLQEAMLAEGGIRVSPAKVDLRFPTMVMAEDAHRKLNDRLPKGYWSISQTAMPID